MVKVLQDRNADIGVAQFANSLVRVPAIDVTAYILVEKLIIFMPIPKTAISAKMNAYFSDFELSIWIVCLVAFLILTGLYYFTSVLGYSKFHMSHDKEKFGLTNAMGVIGLSIVQKDYPIKTRKPFERLLYFTTIVIAFLLFEVYAASLTSVFTADEFVSPINDLSDVVSNNYDISVWRGTAFEQYFKDGLKGSIQGSIYKNIILADPNRNLVVDEAAGMYGLLNKKKQVHFGPIYINRGWFKEKLHNISCEIIDLPMVYRKFNSGFALQKNSEFYSLFNYHIAKLREQGQVISINIRL